MAVAAGAAIVVIPLTGAAAAALVATEPAGDFESVSAESSLNFAEAAEVPEVLAATDHVALALDAPDVTVKKNPKPKPKPEPVVVATTNSSRTSGSTRPVVNSKSVTAAISGSAVIAEAAKYVGTPYARGGSTPAAFDCSGFVSYVYGKLGIDLPHSSGAYYNVGTRVSSPQPGDIIVTPGHVGIYAGPNLQIDASTYGIPVRFHAMWQNDPVYIRVN